MRLECSFRKMYLACIVGSFVILFGKILVYFSTALTHLFYLMINFSGMLNQNHILSAFCKIIIYSIIYIFDVIFCAAAAESSPYEASCETLQTITFYDNKEDLCNSKVIKWIYL